MNGKNPRWLTGARLVIEAPELPELTGDCPICGHPINERGLCEPCLAALAKGADPRPGTEE